MRVNKKPPKIKESPDDGHVLAMRNLVLQNSKYQFMHQYQISVYAASVIG